jgi:hypothetical protein
MDNNEYGKIIEESFSGISLKRVDELPENGTENQLYVINRGEAKTDKQKKLFELASSIVYGGYDVYLYKEKCYEKVIDFWESIEEDLKELLDGE